MMISQDHTHAGTQEPRVQFFVAWPHVELVKTYFPLTVVLFLTLVEIFQHGSSR